MSDSKRQMIMDKAEDAMGQFLYYDRKEDEDLAVGEIEAAIIAGEITIDEIVDRITDALRRNVEGAIRSAGTAEATPRTQIITAGRCWGKTAAFTARCVGDTAGRICELRPDLDPADVAKAIYDRAATTTSGILNVAMQALDEAAAGLPLFFEGDTK